MPVSPAAKWTLVIFGSLAGALLLVALIAFGLWLAHNTAHAGVTIVFQSNIGNGIVAYGCAMHEAFARARDFHQLYLVFGKGWESSVLRLPRRVSYARSGYRPGLYPPQKRVTEINHVRLWELPSIWRAVQVPLRRSVDGASRRASHGRAALPLQ